MKKFSHILAIPCPAQGHVIPMMELSQCLVQHGFQITFVNSDYNHERVLNALLEKDIGDRINLVSIPDGLEPWEYRNEPGKVTKSLFTVAPTKLEELILKINESEDDKISCMIADVYSGWALQVANKMKIRLVAFSPASAALLTQLFNVKRLIDDGIIDNNGNPLKNQKILLGPDLPTMSTTNFLWLNIGEEMNKRILFDLIYKNDKTKELADWVICNSAYDLEPGAFNLEPRIIPIGPLLAKYRQGNSAGSFWPEDTNCLKWLDKQPTNSVIYVAFGSHTTFGKVQFQELALGLELTGKPFLWVVRPGTTNEKNVYPEGFVKRVADRGKIVEWVPQQKVLSHPSVGCFISHCGWNSIMEGLANRVPFLCWPYFADQFLNTTYVYEMWKIGLELDLDEIGIIKHGEINKKVEQVFSDENIRRRVNELKEIVVTSVGNSGRSKKKFQDFIEWLSKPIYAD